MSEAGVWLIVGVQASGKSTTADLLAQQFDRSVHVPGGEFYRWAKRGWIDMDKPAPPEAHAHLDLRYRLSAMVAHEYAQAGFTAVVQDNIYGDDVLTWLDRVGSQPRHLVVLRPRLEVVAAREAARNRATGKTAYRAGGWSIEDLDAGIASLPRVGLWMDNSDLTPEETVAEVRARRTEAIVDRELPGPD